MDRVPAPGEPAQLFVDGAFRTAERAEPVIEAGTGEPLGSGCAANESEVDRAVAAARAALPGWREVPLAERAAVLIRFADALVSRANSTRVLCSRENGMPLALSRGANGAFPAALLRYYAALIVETGVEETRPSMIGHTIVRREPVGAVTSRWASAREPNWSRADRFPPINRAAGSSRRPCSPRWTTRHGSRRRRSSGRC